MRIILRDLQQLLFVKAFNCAHVKSYLLQSNNPADCICKVISYLFKVCPFRFYSHLIPFVKAQNIGQEVAKYSHESRSLLELVMVSQKHLQEADFIAPHLLEGIRKRRIGENRSFQNINISVNIDMNITCYSTSYWKKPVFCATSSLWTKFFSRIKRLIRMNTVKVR